MTDATSDPRQIDPATLSPAELARLRLAAVQSPEFKAALAARIDYDSTPEGQKTLASLIAQSTDKQEQRGLVARKVAGEHARAFGREFWVFVPPMVKRGEPGYREYRDLVNVREELVRLYACAAAETNVWTRPSPGTVENLAAKHAEVVEAEKAAGLKPAAWRNPHLMPGVQDRTPWLTAKRHRPVHVGDVAILITLGLEATWRAGQLGATGNPDAAFRWGYTAQPAGEGKWVFKQAPDLISWAKDNPLK